MSEPEPQPSPIARPGGSEPDRMVNPLRDELFDEPLDLSPEPAVSARPFGLLGDELPGQPRDLPPDQPVEPAPDQDLDAADELAQDELFGQQVDPLSGEPLDRPTQHLADQSGQPHAAATRMPRNTVAMLSGLACLGATVLTLAGAFQPLFSVVIRSGRPASMTITSWNVTFEIGGTVQDAGGGGMPITGVPLMFAVGLLFVATALGLLAAARPPGPLRNRGNSLIAVIAATFLVATVATIGMQELWWRDLYGLSETGAPPGGFERHVGSAFWMLATASALAIVGAIFAWLPPRPAAEPQRVEPETPPLGIPAVRRLPDEPPDQPAE